MITGLAALFTYLFSVLAPGNYFTDPQFIKSVKKQVDDDARVEQLLNEIDVLDEKIKGANNQLQKSIDEFVKLSQVKTAKSDQFTPVLEKIYDQKAELLSLSIDGRLKIVTLITDDEWSVLLSDMDAGRDKFIQNTDKDFRQIAKDLDETEQAIQKLIVDFSKQSSALQAFEAYKAEVTEIMQSSVHVNMHQNEALRTKSTSNEELQEIYAGLNDQIKSLYSSYLEFHRKMDENTTDQEWQAIMHELKKHL